VDAAIARQGRLELHAQLVDVHVDRAVAVAQLPAPHLLVQIGARDDPARTPGERDEQLELAHAEGQRLAAGEAQPVGRPDLQVADLDRRGFLLDVRGLHDAPSIPPRA